MNILLVSYVFSPAVGGIETMSETLAEEFTRQGHVVKVVTQTPSLAPDGFAYEVVRQPSRAHLLRLARECDVFFHNNISLQTAWAALAARKPWVVTHQTWTTRTDGTRGWQDRAKEFLCRYATGISISQAIADRAASPSVVIGNCYRATLFRVLPDVMCDTELVFLGRLVSDKGVDVLLEALGILQAQGLMPRLTIIGDGPEREAFQALAQNLQDSERVQFVGAQGGEELVRLLNRHQIMVVPSRWAEPFGIVALEGAACGCVVVGSESGGLKDAIGPCGVTVPNGDAGALARALAELLSDPARRMHYQQAAPGHLTRHMPEAVARAYLKVFEAAAR